MKRRFLTWCQRVGPRGLGMCWLAPWWLVIGLGTLEQLAGTPHGAYHLLIPAHIRGWLWITSSVVAVVTAHCRRMHWIGVLALAAMPLLRFTSYGGAWVIHTIDPWLPGETPGDSFGWYTCAPWAVQLSAVLGLAFLVGDSWGYLVRRVERVRDGGGDA